MLKKAGSIALTVLLGVAVLFVVVVMWQLIVAVWHA